MTKNKYMGLTYGDPAGIGPEILQKTLLNWNFKFNPLVIGYKKYLRKNVKEIKNVIFCQPKELLFKECNFNIGIPSKFTGLHSYICLREAVKLIKKREIFSLVTGPVSKKAINLAKINFQGQTDAIAKFCKIDPKN